MVLTGENEVDSAVWAHKNPIRGFADVRTLPRRIHQLLASGALDHGFRSGAREREKSLDDDGKAESELNDDITTDNNTNHEGGRGKEMQEAAAEETKRTEKKKGSRE